ncbi:MAG: glycosyl hydrolase, partial [Lachnospiraceae bacterium]
MITQPVNENASAEAKRLLEYMGSIEGSEIITGQHTQTMDQEELVRIHEVTGKLPALCGFELLSYSPNIRRETADVDCLKEVDENTGTLTKAWEWAQKGGIITFTWHWFS